MSAQLESTVVLLERRVKMLEKEVLTWVRMYEAVAVQKEGMELYDEITRLNNENYMLKARLEREPNWSKK